MTLSLNRDLIIFVRLPCNKMAFIQSVSMFKSLLLSVKYYHAIQCVNLHQAIRNTHICMCTFFIINITLYNVVYIGLINITLYTVVYRSNLSI